MTENEIIVPIVYSFGSFSKKVLLGDRESVFALARENFRTYFGRDIGRLCGAR